MNAFDSDNFATVEPEVLTIGDRWVWKRTDLGTNYPPSSYALSYQARLQGAGSTVISITASESGEDYLENTLESIAQKLTTFYTVFDLSNTLTLMEDVRN